MNERAAPPPVAPPPPRAARPRHGPRSRGATASSCRRRSRSWSRRRRRCRSLLIATICAFALVGARLVLLRPARRARGRPGQDRDSRLFQGDRAARSRQGGGDPRRGRPVGQGGRPAVRARPGRSEGGCARRRGRARRQPRRGRAPPLRDRGGPERRDRRRKRRRARTRARRGRRTLAPAAVPDAGRGARRPAELAIAWDEATPEPFRLREEAVLRADLAQLSDALKALDKQMAQKLATRKRLDMSIAFQHTLMDTLNAARRDPPGGDRQSRSAPRSIFTTPRRSWRSRSRSSLPTRAS